MHEVAMVVKAHDRTTKLLVFVLVSVPLWLATRAAQAQTENVLYNFNGTRDGYNSRATLINGGDGDFYGTTTVGGAGYGTVYKLSPNSNGGWNETTIHTFHVDEGTYPTSLISDGKGNLYGATAEGGVNDEGILYRLRPTGNLWQETVLTSFGVGDIGERPFGNIVIDAQGNLFGTDNTITTEYAEAVFEASPSNGYAGKIIYTTSFITATGGYGGLTMDASGNIWGISVQAYEPLIATAFELSPNGGGGWNSKVIFTFPRNAYPEGTPTLDKEGNIYSTSEAGGNKNLGTVYELSLGKDGIWTGKILYSFQGGASDGEQPYDGVVFDTAGNIYGATAFGGPYNAGTVFELSRVGEGKYHEQVLWSFDLDDGDQPFASVVLDSAGNLYGTTSAGGGNGCGAFLGCGLAFEIVP
jgi:uncharacterized repeat protein (TIGR03803 family)